ncbi:MAG: hypothetical protein HC915_07520 [Anaerolineae bacterium]|nr:hypothetical protein [Anaerolineae bacterium]
MPTLELSDELYAALRLRAEEAGQSLSEWLAQMANPPPPANTLGIDPHFLEK